MPYIIPARRPQLTPDVHPQNAGELNFCITYLVKQYIDQGEVSYGVLNEVIGALECAKLELYRRMVEPYEESKRQQNGDVYR